MNGFESFMSDAFGDIKNAALAPTRLFDNIGKSLASPQFIPILIAGGVLLVAFKVLGK